MMIKNEWYRVQVQEVLKLTYSSGLQIESIIISPDKAVVFSLLLWNDNFSDLLPFLSLQ